MAYSNSSLATVKVMSPNHSGIRNHAIDRITIHCMVGQLTAKRCGELFLPRVRQASSNYGIGTNGEIGLYVEEKNRSWCSYSSANDNRAVTIECACDLYHPYAMNDKVWKSIIRLCTDICKRNGKTKLLWLGDKSKTLAYKPLSNEMVLTAHRWFQSTACPGDWLYSRLSRVASEVTAALKGNTTAKTPATTTKPNTTTQTTTASGEFKVQVLIPNLYIRKGPGTIYGTNGYTGKGTFTITATNGNKTWGKLKSGAGWIYLANAKWVKKV